MMRADFTFRSNPTRILAAMEAIRVFSKAPATVGQKSDYDRSNCDLSPRQKMAMPTTTTLPLFSTRTECPPGACNCGRDALLQNPGADLRVLRLTREDEKRLLQRLENLSSLDDLHRMEERMAEQVGIRLSISTSPNVVRSLRGITILVHEQPGLCRKTRQAIPAAIKRSLEQRPEIAYEILNVGGLFENE